VIGFGDFIRSMAAKLYAQRDARLVNPAAPLHAKHQNTSIRRIDRVSRLRATRWCQKL
jgi:hypothetical protein